MIPLNASLLAMAMGRMGSPLTIPGLGMPYPDQRASLPPPIINNAIAIVNHLVNQYLEANPQMPQITPDQRAAPTNFVDELIGAIGRVRMRGPAAQMRTVIRCERGHVITERRLWNDFALTTDTPPRLHGYCGSCTVNRDAVITLEPIIEDTTDDEF